MPTACHRCDISSKEAVLQRCNDAEIDSTNSLHALAFYAMFSKRFKFMIIEYEANFLLLTKVYLEA